VVLVVVVPLVGCWLLSDIRFKTQETAVTIPASYLRPETKKHGSHTVACSGLGTSDL
jgi:hypothetical protein